MGLRGSHSGGESPQVRRDNFVPSVLELGIPLGGWEGPRLRIKHT